MKKLLVTGSAGLVGSACVELFTKKGWEVVGIDNNSRSKNFGTEAKKIEHECDIKDTYRVNRTFEEFGPFNAIANCAGQPSHDWATDHVHEDFLVNAWGTLNLLEATRKNCPEAVFVHVSTDKVYGENMKADLTEEETRYMPKRQKSSIMSYGNDVKDFPSWGNRVRRFGFDEDLGLDFAGDRSFFGCSKAAADMYAQQYAARGMKVGIFRPGCITGKNHAGSEWHGFLAYMAYCIKNEKPYKIHGTGKQVRDQIHASDVAEAFFEFIESPKPNAIYNLGGGPERSVSVLEAIKLFEEATGKKAITEYAPERLGDRRYDVHDISKFRRDYPSWEYNYNLSDIIKDLCN